MRVRSVEVFPEAIPDTALEKELMCLGKLPFLSSLYPTVLQMEKSKRLSSFHPNQSLAVTSRSSGIFVFYCCVTSYHERKGLNQFIF